MSDNRTMPWSEAAELEVLGVVLLTSSFVSVSGLSPADFFDPGHQAVFEAMASLDRAAKPIDSLTVAEEMRHAGTLEKLNGKGGAAAFLNEVQSAVVSVENVAYHAGIIAKKAERRRWIYTATQIAAAGYGTAGDEEFIAASEQALLELTSRSAVTAAAPIKPALRTWTHDLQARYERHRAGASSITGIRTGLTAFDELLSGLQPGDLVIVAARPSMGKTAFAMAATEGAAVANVPTYVFSLEMGNDSLVDRLVSANGRVDGTRIRTGNLDTASWVRVSNGTSRLAEMPIWLDDTGSLTITELRSRARRWRLGDAKRSKDALVVVDYLQLVEGSAKRNRGGSREQEVSDISRGLKALAKELNCPVLALSQLNRGVEQREDKRPKMSDLRESGAIEQDADVIAFLYRDEVYSKDKCRAEDQGVAEVIVAKQRKGPTGTVRLAWIPEYTKFENLSYRGGI